MGSCSGLTDEVENGVAVVTAVGDNVAPRRQIPQELRHDALVVSLPCGQNDANRQTIVVHDRVDLGAQSPTRDDRWRDPRPLFTARRMLMGADD